MKDLRKQKVAMEAIELIGKLDCAPVKFSLGYTRNNICQTGLVIHSCPPAVINELIKADYMLDMQEDGLHVDKI